MKRIVCVGNGLVEADRAGPAVFAELEAQGVPAGVEIADGGLGGLRLLPLLEHAERVVLVDSMKDFLDRAGCAVFEAAEVATLAPATWDHTAGLSYLLRVAPAVCPALAPSILVLGVEGRPTPKRIAHAAAWAVDIAVNGYRSDWSKSTSEVSRSLREHAIR